MDAASGKVIADMSGENRRQVVLKGGKGGNGNMHYATATMQVPKYAQPGQAGTGAGSKNGTESHRGRRTRRLPERWKIDPAFPRDKCRTENCKLSLYHAFPEPRCRRLEGCSGFVIADIPGLIEGASEGVGLGHEFLRHIERTRVMIHVVDVASTEGRDPVDDINKINKELEAITRRSQNARRSSRPIRPMRSM